MEADRSVISKLTAAKVIEGLDVEAVVRIIVSDGLAEFEELVVEKSLDGRKLMNLTEGIIKLWRPKINAKKLMKFKENLELNPQHYITKIKKNFDVNDIEYRRSNGNSSNTKVFNTNREDFFLGNMSLKESASMRNRVQIYGISTKNRTKHRTSTKDEEISMKHYTNIQSVDDILNDIEPPKSFLYRHHVRSQEKINSSYVPMDMGSFKAKQGIKLRKPKSKINDYINFDLHKLKMFPITNKNEDVTFDDRGYYMLKRASNATVMSDIGAYDSIDISESSNTNKKNYQTINQRHTVQLEQEKKYNEDHFYEDLNDEKLDINKNNGELRRNSTKKDPNPLSKSPYMFRLNEVFSSLTFPIKSKFTLSSAGMTDSKDSKGKKSNSQENDNIYENNESTSEFYDSIDTCTVDRKINNNVRVEVPNIDVEEYLVPIQPDRDYTDVFYKEKEESLVAFFLRMFENSFGYSKEAANEVKPIDSEHNRPETSKPSISKPLEAVEPPERPMETLQRWNEGLRANRKSEVRKTNMADRPLPVPVENEFYYMDVDRLEASKLLEGHADGTFILRPSSQPFHAYTISLAYRGKVHNVGVRRRPDGRLALGFSKKSEQSFLTIKDLIEHHYKERLLLIVDGVKIGSTQLRRIHG